VSERHGTGSMMTEGRAGRGELLASDADRDAVAGQLSSALAEGRLTIAEHAERVGVTYAARTVTELGALTADLPARAGNAAGRNPAFFPGEVDRCLLCALLILCPPAGIAWLLAARRHARAATGRAPAAAEPAGPGGAGAEDR
jgi:hypothetical protein